MKGLADTDPRERRAHRARGFTLFELAIVLVVLGVAYAIWSSLLPWINEGLRFSRTRKIMDETEQALIAFARTNSRLPCPDTSATPNGLEGSGVVGGCQAADVVGLVPHETLLLSAPVQDGHHAPILYALYRNGAADLAVLENRVDSMDDVDGANVLTPRLNILDFCQALRNATPAAGAGWASTSTLLTVGGCAGGAVLNQAFVLASPGRDDADGDAQRLDGDNALPPPTCFASPQQGRSAPYDDVVEAMSFQALLGELCRVPPFLGLIAGVLR